MNDVGTVVSVVFPVLTIIVSGACLLLFATTSTLRATNGDQGERIKVLEGEQARDKALITGQASEIAALQKVVTGEVQLQAIADVLDHHHAQAVQMWGRVDQVLDHTAHILDLLEERAK